MLAVLLGANALATKLTIVVDYFLQAPQLAASLKVTEPFHPQSMSRFYGRKIHVEN
jgi:hypothetical protein